jgi:hypothetical protein
MITRCKGSRKKVQGSRFKVEKAKMNKLPEGSS